MGTRRPSCVKWLNFESMPNRRRSGWQLFAAVGLVSVLSASMADDSVPRWSAVDVAFREAMNADPNYTTNEVASRDVAVKGWQQLLLRQGLSQEQRAFAWWRIGSLFAYNYDASRGERADNARAENAFKEARRLFDGLVCGESLNAATVYSSIPGEPSDQARRLSEAYTWIMTRTEEDVKSSAQRVNKSGSCLEAKYFPNIARAESTVDEREQLLRNQLAKYRESIAGKIGERVTYGSNVKAIDQLLKAVTPLASSNEVKAWRTMADKANAKQGRVPTRRRGPVIVILGALTLVTAAFGWVIWRASFR
jgi:hypothetical protein